MSSKKMSLDTFLHDIYKEFIAIKDDDEKKSFKVFEETFKQIQDKMKEVNKYFERYSSKIQYAGSFYDGIKVGKLNEFDMDLVIRLPVNRDDEGENGIMMENHIPGFVKMRISNPFDNLDVQPNWESHHKVTKNWRDDEKYFLQSNFRSWVESIVQKAVNLMERKVIVQDITYNLCIKKAGPAFTLKVENTDLKFKLDVDLVPVIEFRLPRWPKGYRKVEDSSKETWLVVPKPLKAIDDSKIQNRCWRLAFHDQEKEILKGNKNLKPTIRLLKKLRDSLGMKAIASYYIKTIFLWEIDNRKSSSDKKNYWENKFSVLFRDMVAKLLDAIEKKNIPYYWNKGYNLIDGINDNLAKQYKENLLKIVASIDENACEKVIAKLLTPKELELYSNTENYKQLMEYNSKSKEVKTPVILKSAPELFISKVKETSPPDTPDGQTCRNDFLTEKLLKQIVKSNELILEKLDRLEMKVFDLEKKFSKLEIKNDEVCQNSTVSMAALEVEGADLLLRL